LLKGLLAFSPDKRFTVDEAINHPYFEELRKRDIPPKCMKEFDWQWEENLRSKSRSLQQDQEDICRLIYNESLTFHPEEEDQNKPP